MSNSTSRQLLPSFLCIGAQKAATSWLWVMLRQHPEIWMPPIKELHFFDHLYIPENGKWTLNHIKKGVVDALRWHVKNEEINLEYFKYLIDIAMEQPFSEEWYRQCFNRHGVAGKCMGDVTPEYSTLPEEGVEYVSKLLGANLKIIYIIRNPVERAISQLKMNLTRRGKEMESEEFWIESAKDPVIAQRGDYAAYIPRWEKYFPLENILYLPYKQVKANPLQLLHRIESHLGISNYANYTGVGSAVHKTREAKVPAGAVRYLTEALAPQSDFLKKHFSEEFQALT